MAKRFFVYILTDSSSILLIISNIIVIFESVVNHWSVIDLMLIYWVQSIIIGFFQIFKILDLEKFKEISEGDKAAVDSRGLLPTLNFIRQVQNQNPEEAQKQINDFYGFKETIHYQSNMRVKIFYASFFVFHYGAFHIAYLLFILQKNPNVSLLLQTAPIFFVNHLFSYLKNRSRDKSQIKTINNVMGQPYIRILPMHLMLFIADSIKLSSVSLIIFQLLKTVADISAHYNEHWINNEYPAPSQRSPSTPNSN